MGTAVVRGGEGHRLIGEGLVVEPANRYLAHLGTRGFSPATVRAYAFDLANFARFLAVQQVRIAEVGPTDLFDYLDWQARATRHSVSAASSRSPGANACARDDEPSHRCGAGILRVLRVRRAPARQPRPSCTSLFWAEGASSGTPRAPRPGAPTRWRQLVKEPRRLPESLDPCDVSAFLALKRTGTGRSCSDAARRNSLRRGAVSPACRCRHGPFAR